MKKIQYSFTWNGLHYGKSNGKKNKFYKASDMDFNNAEEITPNEYLEKAEQYSQIFCS